MFKDTLKQRQPVVWQTLHNALNNNTVSHCYLFIGQAGTLTKETAYLLAQSMICTHKEDGFACEQCEDCQRIKENGYADLVYIDGSKETIKIEAINNLQNQFSQTALEVSGKKIFIINACENMTGKASNSLLKFIEEPSSNTMGIFITSNPTKVLPTIVSRCQTLNFKPLSKEDYYQKALDQNIDELNAHIISNIAHNESDISTIANLESYQNALNIFVEYLNRFLSNPKTAMIYLQGNGFKMKDKKQERECFGYFLSIANIFVSDYHNQNSVDDETWTSLLAKANKDNFDSLVFLQAISESKDALNRSANLSLLVDQFLYKTSKRR